MSLTVLPNEETPLLVNVQQQTEQPKRANSFVVESVHYHNVSAVGGAADF